MIAAILKNDIPVEIEDAGPGFALVTSMGRENIYQHYVGGEGYQGTKFASVDPDLLSAVALVDPKTCEPLQNWNRAMNDVDRLASEQSPAIAAALDIEEDARRAFIDHIRLNALQRAIPVEIPAYAEAFQWK
jgi:hypothetical protein